MKMNANSVHRYMSLVQCPLCRDRYMEEGDEACWECLAQIDPNTSPEALAQDRERLHAAVQRLHAARLEAEADSGALGSMAGMGFVPWKPDAPENAPEDLDAPLEPERPLPVFAPTYAGDTGWRGDAEAPILEPLEQREGRAIRTVPASHIVLGAAGGLVVLSILVFALAALVAGLALGAAVYLAWRLLMAPRR